MVKPSVMLQAHLTCIKQVAKLPRKILKIDRKVKFDKNYSGLFKENYEVFGYNQNVADEITPIDSFESHVMGITPAPAYEFSSVDEGQNPGFTSLNSFESDVMGITPLDSSSSDYQI